MMRQLRCGWARVALFTLASLTTLACCKAADAPPGTIYRTDHAIVIDGSLDKPCWRAAQPIEVNFRHDATGARDPHAHMIARFTWDEHYLYVGYDICDANLVAVPRGKPKGPEDNLRQGLSSWAPDKKDDLAEFMISFNDPQFIWEIQHNAANQFSEVWDIVPPEDSPARHSSMIPFWARHFLAFDEYIHDDGPYKVAFAVRLKPKADGKPSTVNDPSDVDTGYTAEIRLPWRGLGAPVTWRVNNTSPKVAPNEDGQPMVFDLNGHTMELLSIQLDGDYPSPYFHSSPTLPARALFAPGHAYWPRYRFTGKTHADEQGM